LTVHKQTCAHCGRTVYECGQARIIEAARTSSGDEPAEEFLQRLERSQKGKNTRRLADVAIVFEQFARTGTLEIPRELNDLRRGGLWEIKADDTRFPFYEFTDGDHSATIARLTSGFLKGTPKTPRKEIDNALWVMGEDRQS
jgi:hypothetical protein